MKGLVWLDVPLVVLGLLAMSPQLWNWFRRRRSVCPPSRDRVRRKVTDFLFYLGLGSLAVVLGLLTMPLRLWKWFRRR